jgi:hypothetical protein
VLESVKGQIRKEIYCNFVAYQAKFTNVHENLKDRELIVINTVQKFQKFCKRKKNKHGTTLRRCLTV